MNGLNIAVCARAKDLEAEWLALQETGWVTPYQSFDWVNTWQTAVSDLTGEDVRIVTIRDDNGQLHGIFPLRSKAVRRTNGCLMPLNGHGG